MSAPTESARAIATTFYEAFVKRDFDAMEKLYAESVMFEDPVFAYRDRAGTMRMWRGLLGRAGRSFQPTFEVRGSEGDTARVRWQADYKFLGRKVHNEIDAELTIRDGKIVAHRDVFSWARWARQALPLGPLGATRIAQFLITRLLRRMV